MTNRKALGNFMLLTAALIWGSAFVAQRVGMETIEPCTFNAARSAVGACAVGGLSLFLGKKKRNDKSEEDKEARKAENRQTLIGGLCCGLILSAAGLSQQAGLVYTPAGKAGFITAMYMLVVPIISLVVFRKRYAFHVWLAVAAGVAGLYLLCMTDGFTLAKGDALVCLCAVLFGCHILCCDHFVQKGDAVRISAVQFAVAAAVSSIPALILETPTWDKIVSAMIPILYCGLFSSGIAFTLQIAAQKFTEPTVASLLMSLESVFAVLTGALMLHERMTAREGLGCLIMFAAIILVQIPLPAKKPSLSV